MPFLNAILCDPDMAAVHGSATIGALPGMGLHQDSILTLKTVIGRKIREIFYPALRYFSKS